VTGITIASNDLKYCVIRAFNTSRARCAASTSSARAVVDRRLSSRLQGSRDAA